jgi:hypothetical protein
MKPSKLEKHLMSVNPENASKDVFFFSCEVIKKVRPLPKLGFAISQNPFLESIL